MKEVVIYTDGACKGNPGPGGWGAFLSCGGHTQGTVRRRAAHHQQPHGTDAPIEALCTLKQPCAVTIFTDSQYLRNGISTWIHAWKARGWKTADHKPVKNIDLWQRLDALVQQHRVTWQWVKAHNGDPGNEKADALANRGVPAP